jgi:hypothetical protein
MRQQRWNGAGRRRLVGALVGAGAAALVSCSAPTSNGKPPIPPGAMISSWHYNGAGGRYLLQIEEGRTPAQGERLSGLVKTDTDCDADAQNLNHCRNTIELSDGSRIDVVDNHEMARHRCLSPGEPITLTRFGAGWVIGKVSGSRNGHPN